MRSDPNLLSLSVPDLQCKKAETRARKSAGGSNLGQSEGHAEPGRMRISYVRLKDGGIDCRSRKSLYIDLRDGGRTGSLYHR